MQHASIRCARETVDAVVHATAALAALTEELTALSSNERAELDPLLAPLWAAVKELLPHYPANEVTHHLAAFAASRRAVADAPVMVALTAAEQRVLPYLMTRLSMRQIAESLWVSKHTVSTQIAAIYRKLGVHNRIDAISAAVAAGMLDRAAPVPVAVRTGGQDEAFPAVQRMA